MSSVLAADDLNIGDYVAVHSTRHMAIVQDEEGTQLAIDPCSLAALAVGIGVPLRVIGMSLPFVACGVLVPGGSEPGPVILDVRRVHLIRLSSEFVQCLADFELACLDNSNEVRGTASCT